MNIQLPNLSAYRSDLIKKGAQYPLNNVPAPQPGLLNILPPPPPHCTSWPWTKETDPAIYHKSTNWPKLTIVTPSYNQDKFLEETIRSVLLQNYPNLEYIIIDGGSTDGSAQIIEKYAPWISYWQSEKDSGQGNAINQGFSLASGNYYAWINSDDYYLKDTFYKVITSFLSKKIDFVYGYGYDKHKEGNTQLQIILPVTDYFLKIPGIVQPSTFWAAAIHQPIWEELNCALDYELWIRMIKGKKKYLIRQPLSTANVHIEAKTSNPKMKGKWHEDHVRIWAENAHGSPKEWDTIMFFNRIRKKIYRLLNLY